MSPSIAEIAASVRSMESEMLALLSDFVAFESYSGKEAPAMAFLAGLLARAGLAVRQIPMPPPHASRVNILAEHEPSADSGRSLLFNGHVDIVPTGPLHLWESPPFRLSVRGRKAYGRGAADMKAGLLCAVWALLALRRLGAQPSGRVGFNAVVDEERSGEGTRVSVPHTMGYDAVIIPEPFGETISVAQVGVFWIDIHVEGVPSHAGAKARGANAVEIAISVFEALKDLEEEWNAPDQRHPLYAAHDHPINFNLGRIHGGEWTSSVPSQCDMAIRIGTYPGRSLAVAEAAVEAAARRAIEAFGNGPKITFGYDGMRGEGCTVDAGHPALRALEEAHALVHGCMPARIALTAATDARHFANIGKLPVTCYGPAGDGIHGVNEAVDLDSMVRVATVFARHMLDWCGCEPASGKAWSMAG